MPPAEGHITRHPRPTSGTDTLPTPGLGLRPDLRSHDPLGDLARYRGARGEDRGPLVRAGRPSPTPCLIRRGATICPAWLCSPARRFVRVKDEAVSEPAP